RAKLSKNYPDFHGGRRSPRGTSKGFSVPCEYIYTGQAHAPIAGPILGERQRSPKMAAGASVPPFARPPCFMLIDYVSLIGGFAILIVAGDLLVRGAVGIAERLGIPSLVIGLTIVAFGTSAPEMVISVKAALNGAPGIAVGNVIGSNICNVLAVLGMPALVAAISCREEGATRNSLIMVAISVIFIAMLSLGVISRIG